MEVTEIATQRQPEFPASMTAAQYDQIIGRLDAAGTGNPAGRLHHTCFGSGDKLQVFEVWESQQAFDKFGETTAWLR